MTHDRGCTVLVLVAYFHGGLESGHGVKFISLVKTRWWVWEISSGVY